MRFIKSFSIFSTIILYLYSYWIFIIPNIIKFMIEWFFIKSFICFIVFRRRSYFF